MEMVSSDVNVCVRMLLCLIKEAFLDKPKSYDSELGGQIIFFCNKEKLSSEHVYVNIMNCIIDLKLFVPVCFPLDIQCPIFIIAHVQREQ